MRSFLMGLTILAGAVAVVPAANAGLRFVNPGPVFSDEAAVQPVQYYGHPEGHGHQEERWGKSGGWRHRDWRRHEAYERFGRHETWRHQHYMAHGHGRGGW